MPKFDVRLESQTDRQARHHTIEAASADEARKVAEQAEAELVAFSLLPPAKELWECPPGGPDSPDGLVDLSRWDAYDVEFARHAASGTYEDAVRAATDRLERLSGLIEITPAGKVRSAAGVSGRARARFHAHHQQEPYRVAEIVQVEQERIDRERLVRELAGLTYDPAGWQRTLDSLREGGTPTAAVTAFLYGVPLANMFGGTSVWDWDTSVIICTLLTGHTPAQDTHDYFNDVAANEISGTGYSSPGATMTCTAPSYDTASDQVRMDASDVSWTTSTLSATHATVANNTAGATTTDPLIGLVDFGGTVSTTAGTFQITWDTTGVVVLDLT